MLQANRPLVGQGPEQRQVLELVEKFVEIVSAIESEFSKRAELTNEF
jgi:hypothetical protein